jgi:hypothetical protein
MRDIAAHKQKLQVRDYTGIAIGPPQFSMLRPIRRA